MGADSPGESITWLNLLIYGEPGAGKTYLIGTAEDHPETNPVLILDVDGGTTTLRHRKTVDVVQVRSMAKLSEVYSKLWNATQEGKCPYNTIAIDTLTELQNLDMIEIMDASPAVQSGKQDKEVPSPREWGITGNHMRKIVRKFRDLPCNVIFTCHLKTERNAYNQDAFFPSIPGKLKNEILGFIDVVGQLRAETGGEGVVNRYLQTMKTERVSAKDRTNAFLGIIENPNIPDMWNQLKESNK